MRRSLRKIDTQEVANYPEEEQLFTVLSLDEARQRLTAEGLDPASYCFFTWMREGIRYYRVWEDKKLKQGIVQPANYGQVAARLKRADAEKLYTVAKRYHPPADSDLAFDVTDGTIRVKSRNRSATVLTISVPQVGGDLIFEQDGEANWSPRQAAHFLNVVLARGQSADVAYQEADNLQ